MEPTTQNEANPASTNPYIARYQTPSLRVLQGNPFIEALPARLSSGEFIKRLNRWPLIGEEERSLPDHDRKLALSDLKRLYITSGVHEDITERCIKNL